MDRKREMSSSVAGEAGFSFVAGRKIRLVISRTGFGFSCTREGGIWCCTKKERRSQQRRKGGGLPCLKDCVVMQQHHRQKIIIRNSKWHSKGRKTATDIAVSSGTAELQTTKINKMQPALYPQHRPLLDSRSNPQIRAPLLQTDGCPSFLSPATLEISPTYVFVLVFDGFCFLSHKRNHWAVLHIAWFLFK